jgi:uncharacterized cupredoxin-like copper-binding protein
VSIRSIWTLGIVAALALVLATLAAACGDDGDDNGDAVTPAETSASTSEEPAGPTSTAGGPTATGGGSGDLTQIAASLDNTPFGITVSQDTVPAGRTSIQVTNEGTVGHNFWVIRTDLAPDDLPVENNVVDTDSLDVITNSTMISEGENLEPGAGLQIVTTLEAGSYVFICNVPDHYGAGMNAGLTVQ